MANQRVVDLDQLAKDAANAQAEFQKLTRELMESARKLTVTQWSTNEAAHRRLWEASTAARKSIEEKMIAYHKAALQAAGVPEGHPLWAWVRKL